MVKRGIPAAAAYGDPNQWIIERRVAQRSNAMPQHLAPPARLPLEALQALGLAPQPSVLSAVAVPTCGPPQGGGQRQLPPTRRDAPVLSHSAGARGVAVDLSATGRQQLLEDLAADVRARSAVAPACSLLRTWSRYHIDWFGAESPPFPVTQFSLRAVASQMKRRGYRSWPNYLSRAKSRHIELGFDWTQLLELTGRECSRSVLRGIGPPRQSAELDIDKVQALVLGDDPVVEDGPACPKELFILGALFLCRELELSSACVEHFSVEPGPVVVWKLPASKTDPLAVSVTRRWGCLCSPGNQVCPAHTAQAHMDALHRRFGELGPNMPLFPTAAGGTASKCRVVRTVEFLAQQCDEPLLDALQRRRFGGHSMRVSGARYLANAGLELYKLAVLARWESSIILRYVAEAPLNTLTSDCRRLLAGESLLTVLDSLSSPEASAKVSVMCRANVSNALEEHRVLQRLAKLENQLRYKFLQNTVSGVWHRVAQASMHMHHCTWATVCGWRFSRADYALRHERPADPDYPGFCRTCEDRAAFAPRE